jgi:catechol 2,3-dioxygenase-like lactoylglutathione lyase family enzyme
MSLAIAPVLFPDLLGAAVPRLAADGPLFPPPPGAQGLMITSIHTLIYSDDAPATRAFLRDVLGWPYVEDALGGGAGWLIFKTGRSEMSVHPTHSVYDGKTYESPRHHLISLMCDDMSHTVAELKGKGAEFRGEVQDHGYGLVVMMAVPGADDIMLYEPKHPLAYSL